MGIPWKNGWLPERNTDHVKLTHKYRLLFTYPGVSWFGCDCGRFHRHFDFVSRGRGMFSVSGTWYRMKIRVWDLASLRCGRAGTRFRIEGPPLTTASTMAGAETRQQPRKATKTHPASANHNANGTERLKTVVRRLPPNLPEDVFWQSVQAWVTDDTVTWKVYHPGKLRRRTVYVFLLVFAGWC